MKDRLRFGIMVLAGLIPLLARFWMLLDSRATVSAVFLNAPDLTVFGIVIHITIIMDMAENTTAASDRRKVFILASSASLFLLFGFLTTINLIALDPTHSSAGTMDGVAVIFAVASLLWGFAAHRQLQ